MKVHEYNEMMRWLTRPKVDSSSEQLGKGSLDDFSQVQQTEIYNSALKRVTQDMRMKQEVKRMKDIEQKIELEMFDPKDRKPNAYGGIAGQLLLNRPGYDTGGTTQIADKETNPYEYDTLEYWEWYLDKSMSRDPRYMGYWGTAHINDLIKRYEEAGGDALKYKTLFNKKLEKHTEHFKSRDPEAQQKWLEREKEEFKKNYDKGIIPGQPQDEKSTPIIKAPYEQEIAQGGRVSYTKGGLAHVLGV